MNPHLTAVSMIRNEADILPSFLRHCAALFDRLVIVDHWSTDGSREMIESARRAGHAIEIYDYRVHGYFQGAISTALAKNAFADGTDWVLFLDADEFVNVDSGEALRALLAVQRDPVCKFRWRNLAPTRFGDFGNFDPRQEFLVAATPSRFRKVALSRRLIETAPNFAVAMGNHEVHESPGGAALSALDVGEYWHVPIRSRERLRAKVANGIAAYRATGRRSKDEMLHWFELERRIHEGLSDESCRRIALSYGEPGRTRPSARFERRRIEPVMSPEVELPAGLDEPAAADRDRSVLWRRFESAGVVEIAISRAEKTVDVLPRAVRPDGEPGPLRFHALAPNDALENQELSFARLANLVDSSSRAVETLVPSTWSRLAPVSFAAFNLLRPRRFVELGTYYGGSFFAACQARRELDLSTECVAVDTWLGDAQSNFYEEEVFERFTQLLRSRYPDGTRYIRARFDDAARCFDSGSIDLLHIDGLHTYEAVRADFETWLPKMSDRGVMMLHDTNVHEQDFGVVRLWQEISARYPGINLLHSYGLGIAYVGNQAGPISHAFGELATNPELSSLVNTFFRNVGELSLRAAAAAERDQLQMELARMRNSTSWRVSAPIRELGRALRRVLR